LVQANEASTLSDGQWAMEAATRAYTGAPRTDCGEQAIQSSVTAALNSIAEKLPSHRDQLIATKTQNLVASTKTIDQKVGYPQSNIEAQNVQKPSLVLGKEPKNEQSNLDAALKLGTSGVPLRTKPVLGTSIGRDKLKHFARFRARLPPVIEKWSTYFPGKLSPPALNSKEDAAYLDVEKSLRLLEDGLTTPERTPRLQLLASNAPYLPVSSSASDGLPQQASMSALATKTPRLFRLKHIDDAARQQPLAKAMLENVRVEKAPSSASAEVGDSLRSVETSDEKPNGKAVGPEAHGKELSQLITEMMDESTVPNVDQFSGQGGFYMKPGTHSYSPGQISAKGSVSPTN
jgi:hypothetical protein